MSSFFGQVGCRDKVPLVKADGKNDHSSSSLSSFHPAIPSAYIIRKEIQWKYPSTSSTPVEDWNFENCVKE
jgi:hypothetical protein